MYTLALQSDFIASHYLIGGEWGAENDLHAHHYRIQAILQAADLDVHGYLVDIVDLKRALDGGIAHFKDKTLNDLAEFTGKNPSVERLARCFWDLLIARLDTRLPEVLEIRIWENETAWASYRKTL